MTKSLPAADLEAILSRLPHIWDQLRGVNIFLTGGTGWFGRTLLEAITHANRVAGTDIRVTILTRAPDLFFAAAPHIASDPTVTLHAGDVQDFAFPSAQFSHIIHAATTSAHETFAGESPLAKFDTLVAGTRRVLDFARQAETRKFLFTSSGVAYAPPQDDVPIPETCLRAPDTCAPDTTLGQAKRVAEVLCTTYGHEYGMNVTIARCFSFVGPFMPLDLHYAIGNFIQEAMHNRPIVIQGDGSPIRSYLYTADLIVWLLALLLRKGAPRTYNVGSDQGISILDLAQLIKDVTHSRQPIHVLGNEHHSIGNPVRNSYVPNITRAQNELSLAAWTDLRSSIRQTIATSSPGFVGNMR